MLLHHIVLTSGGRLVGHLLRKMRVNFRLFLPVVVVVIIEKVLIEVFYLSFKIILLFFLRGQKSGVFIVDGLNYHG
jgi:hypothetical protein